MPLVGLPQALQVQTVHVGLNWLECTWVFLVGWTHGQSLPSFSFTVEPAEQVYNKRLSPIVTDMGVYKRPFGKLLFYKLLYKKSRFIAPN